MKERGLLLRQFYHTGDDGIERPSGSPWIPWWTMLGAAIIVLIVLGFIANVTESCEDRGNRVMGYMDMSAAYSRAGNDSDADRYDRAFERELRKYDEECSPRL